MFVNYMKLHVIYVISMHNNCVILLDNFVVVHETLPITDEITCE